MYTSKLIGWIVPIVFVSVLSSICIIGEWISRPEKSYYAECMSQMNRLVEIFGIDPTKYVGMESRDIHARLIEEYRKEYEASCITGGLFDADSGVKRCEHGARSAECLQRAT